MRTRSQENRRSPRHGMNRGAEVVFAPRARCIILDLSDDGARISFDPPVANLPRTFTLVLSKNRAQRNCRVAWAKGRFVGVKFLSDWFGAKLSERPTFPAADHGTSQSIANGFAVDSGTRVMGRPTGKLLFRCLKTGQQFETGFEATAVRLTWRRCHRRRSCDCAVAYAGRRTSLRSPDPKSDERAPLRCGGFHRTRMIIHRWISEN